MISRLRKMLLEARKHRRRELYRSGKVISRFIAKDVKREIEIVSADEVDDGYLTVRMRTWNLLYAAKNLVKPEPLGEPQRVAIEELWKWSGQSWGGLPDGTSITSKSETEIAALNKDNSN